MPRSRLLSTAPIVLAIVLIGVFAIRSRGNDHANVDTANSKDCPPVARADAIATKPGAAISVDVLANDTDPDGDPLVFQILKTAGGDSSIDDGGTPTDASDDRVLFTPADPPPDTATIEYQALDPQGAVGESKVTVYINADGALPAGVQSDPVTSDATSDATGRCGDTQPTSTTEDVTAAESPTSSTASTALSVTVEGTPTTRKGSTPKHTTTTRKSSTSTTKAPSTTQPHTTTSSPATTAPHPTTTQTTGTTQPDPCGPYPVNGSQDDKNAWVACEQAHNGG